MIVVTKERGKRAKFSQSIRSKSQNRDCKKLGHFCECPDFVTILFDEIR